jgi:hypothetical protein
LWVSLLHPGKLRHISCPFQSFFHCRLNRLHCRIWRNHKKAMHIQCIVVARSLNVYTCSAVLITFHSKTALLLRFNITGNNKPYLHLHVKCPVFLTDLNQMWTFSTDFHESSQYQSSR